MAVAKQIRLKEEADAVAARKAECTKEIDEAHTTINKNQEEYDKQLLTLSSGFLVLSLAFIKDIVPTENAIYRGLLYSSFVVLSTCVLAVLASYQISNIGLSKAKEYWEHQREGDILTPFPYGYAAFIRRWNIVSGLLFVLGIVLSVSFVVINLHQEALVPDKFVKVQEGAQMKTIPSGDWAQKGANVKAPPPPPSPTPKPPTDNKK